MTGGQPVGGEDFSQRYGQLTNKLHKAEKAAKHMEHLEVIIKALMEAENDIHKMKTAAMRKELPGGVMPHLDGAAMKISAAVECMSGAVSTGKG
jgi:hypothetical protein